MNIKGHEVMKMEDDNIKFRDLSEPLKLSVIFSYITSGFIITLVLIGLAIGMFKAFWGV
jgi:hypothetical protein